MKTVVVEKKLPVWKVWKASRAVLFSPACLCITTLFVAFLVLLHASQTVMFHEDEYIFLKRGFLFDIYTKKDFKNQAWSSRDAYDPPKFAEYLYGATLHAYGVKKIDQYLNSVNFNQNEVVDPPQFWAKAYSRGNYSYSITLLPKHIRRKIEPILIARTAAVLCTILLLLSMYLIAQSLYGPAAGIMSTIILLSNPLFRSQMVRAVGDSPLWCFIFGIIVLSPHLYKSVCKNTCSSYLYTALASILAGLALSTKLNGILGLLIIILILFLAWITKPTKLLLLRCALLSSEAIMITAAIFYILNPFIWAAPVERFLYMCQFRVAESQKQAMFYKNSALGTIEDRLTTVGKRVFFNGFYSSIKIGPQAIPLDALIGCIGFLAISSFFRQPYSFKSDAISPYTQIKKYIAKKVLFLLYIAATLIIWVITILNIVLDWDRYYLPFVIASAPLQAAGIIWIVQKIGTTLKENMQRKKICDEATPTTLRSRI